MRDIQVNITHTTWVRCTNGTTIPNDILCSVQDTADEVGGDIVVEIKTPLLHNRERNRTVRYHFDYDNDVWHDEEGYAMDEDGDWDEDPEWSWPTHLVDDTHRDDGTE